MRLFVFGLYCMNIPCFVYQFIIWWTLDCSYLSAVVPRTFVYQYLFGYLFSFLLGMCLGMELLGHMIIVCLTCWVWYSWIGASLLAQTIKNLPAVRETWVQFLGQEGTLEKGMAIHSSILAWRTRRQKSLAGPWGHKESDTTEWLTLTLFWD